MKKFSFPSTLFMAAVVLVGFPMSIIQACNTPPSTARAEAHPVSAGPDHWEYKQVIVDAKSHERLGKGASDMNALVLSEDDMNKLGADGWELATSWVEPETSYPNFSPDASFFTGIQPNVRPMRGVLLFKRRKS